MKKKHNSASAEPALLGIRGAIRRFTRFKAKAEELGIVPIDPKREARDLEMQNVVKPDSPRIAALAGQVIMEKEVDGITLRVVTTFDPKYGDFMKAGKLWVRLVARNEEGRESGIFTWKTTRTGDFLDRAFMMMKFLADRLEKWPIDGKKKLMMLKNQVGVSKYHPYIWVGQDKAGKRMTTSFFDWQSAEVRPFITKWKEDLWYYRRVRRKAMGYKRFEWEVRKPYTVEKATKKKK